MRLLIYVVIFYSILGFRLFADEINEAKEDQSTGVACGEDSQIPKATLKQAEWFAGTSTTILKTAFTQKVRVYAGMEGMNMKRAKIDGIGCIIGDPIKGDPLKIVKVISFEKDASRKPSKHIWFESSLKNWFEENGIHRTRKEPDKKAGMFRAGISLIASDDCKTCHPVYEKDSLIGALVFDIPLKSNDEE